MRIQGDGQLLRIFIGESDRWEGGPLYEAIVRAAREQGLAGATVLRGMEGFGANSRIHTVKVLRLSEDLPIVVEIVDRPERIQRFLPTLDKMVTEGMVTLEKVNVLMYRHNSARGEVEFEEEDELQLEAEGDVGPEIESAPQALKAAFSNTTERARKIIDIAKAETSRSRRVYIDSVDVLLAMLRESEGIAGRVLADLKVDSLLVEQCLREQVNREPPSEEFARALDRKSQAEAKWLKHNYVGTEHLLLALCEIRPTAATDILTRLGAQPREVCEEVLEIIGRHDDWQRWMADHPEM